MFGVTIVSDDDDFLRASSSLQRFQEPIVIVATISGTHRHGHRHDDIVTSSSSRRSLCHGGLVEVLKMLWMCLKACKHKTLHYIFLIKNRQFLGTHRHRCNDFRNPSSSSWRYRHVAIVTAITINKTGNKSLHLALQLILALIAICRSQGPRGGGSTISSCCYRTE